MITTLPLVLHEELIANLLRMNQMVPVMYNRIYTKIFENGSSVSSTL